jgi:hypothetical protein
MTMPETTNELRRMISPQPSVLHDNLDQCERDGFANYLGTHGVPTRSRPADLRQVIC